MTENAIGIVGCGSLGAALAKHMLSIGRKVFVWNRTPDKGELLTLYGAIQAETLIQMIKKCNLLLVCVTDAQVIHDLFFADTVINLLASRNVTIVNIATIGPSNSLGLEQKFCSRDIPYMDMPVSGGPEGVKSGELLLYIGKIPMYSEYVMRIIDDISLRQINLKNNQLAQSIKVLNNLCEAINLWGAAEAMAVAKSLNIDPITAGDGIMAGRGNSAYFKVLLDRIAFPQMEVSVPINIRIKDIDLALEITDSFNGTLPLTEHVRTLYKSISMLIGGDSDQTDCYHYPFFR